MKKLRLIPIILSQIGLLAIGGLTAAIANKPQKSIETVAAEDHSTMGIFKKVLNPINDLSSTDQVIIVGTDQHDCVTAFRRVVSYETPSHVTHYNIEPINMINPDSHNEIRATDEKGNDCFVLAGSDVEIFNPINGMTTDSLAFRGTKSFSGYIGWTSDDNLVNADTKNFSSSWEFEKIGDGFKMINCQSSRMIHNTQGGWYDAHESSYTVMNIYKKVTTVSAEPTTNPTRSTYYSHDPIYYSGLVTNIKYDDGTAKGCWVNGIAYDTIPDLFTGDERMPDNASAGSVNINYTAAGAAGTISMNVENRKTDVGYDEMGILPVDYRSTYYFVMRNLLHTEYNCVFNPLINAEDIDSEGNFKWANITGGNNSGRIWAGNTDYEYIHTDMVISVVRETVQGQSYYYFKTTNNKYITMVGSSMRLTDNPSSKAVITSSGNVQIVEGDNTFNLYFSVNTTDFSKSYFKFQPSNFAKGANDYLVEAYRRGNSDSEINAKVKQFRDLFYTVTGNCDPDGKTNNVTLEGWGNLATLFANIGADAQGYLASLTYNHGQEAAGSDRNMVDRYDYIVNKYASAGFTDFMNRINAGTFQENNSNNPVLLNDKTNNAALIAIVITSINSIVLLTGLLALKKKKEA